MLGVGYSAVPRAWSHVYTQCPTAVRTVVRVYINTSCYAYLHWSSHSYWCREGKSNRPTGTYSVDLNVPWVYYMAESHSLLSGCVMSMAHFQASTVFSFNCPGNMHICTSSGRHEYVMIGHFQYVKFTYHYPEHRDVYDNPRGEAHEVC